jgi:DNA-binding phage protein
MGKRGIVEDLRKAIRQAGKRGITHYQIAKAAEMPQSQLSRVASGETVPTLTTAERICKAIGCQLVIMLAN